MPKITIAGAGIIGLAIASQLPTDYDITIVAEVLPGDEDSTRWASPWAGGIFMPTHGSNKFEQELQLNAYIFLRNLALKHPESSIRIMEMDEILDYIPEEKFWFHGILPGFRVLDKSEIPSGASFGMTYQSVSIHPKKLIEFLRKRLESKGVKFRRVFFKSLHELRGLGHDVLVNATGLGSLSLTDVKDTSTTVVRSQTVLVRTPYNRIMMRHGRDYGVPFTYVIPRHDGTAILGGNRDTKMIEAKLDPETKEGILKRVHETLPEHFPADPAKFDVVQDLVGVQPMRPAGTIIQKQKLNGQNVVHAFGTLGGGYIYSFGVGREVTKKVNEFLFEWSTARL